MNAGSKYNEATSMVGLLLSGAVRRVSQARRAMLRVSCGLVLLAMASGGCSSPGSLDSELGAAIDGHRFNLLGWELRHGLEGTKQPRFEGQPLGLEQERAVVERFFELGVELALLSSQAAVRSLDGQVLNREQVELARRNVLAEREEMRDDVQWIIGRQVRQIYNEQRIFGPLDRLVSVAAPFPPMNFRLSRPPKILVVSPRERIESIREVMLDENLDTATETGLEDRVDSLGVSSLVVEIGGLGATYPTFVADDATLAWTVQTVAEEWLHQYMFFTPLGFLYALDGLGIRRDYEIATMNETVAGIVSSEIAERVLERFYGIAPAEEPLAEPPSEPETPSDPASTEEFDFVREMRRTRLKVDELLAGGRVEEAESYMEERRQVLVAEGYYIRKLNQAYFAFHGTYGDAPTSVSPIGADMRVLRERVLRNRAGSLSGFLNRVVTMTSRADLEQATQ